MAGYGYTNGGYVVQEKSRAGTSIQPWGSPYNGVEARSDQWSKTGFSTNCEGLLCTPDSNTQYIVTRETIIEQIPVPLATRYKDSFPTTVGPIQDYGTINKEWSRPVNPSHERPPIVDEFISKVQTEASRPTRKGLLNGTYWNRTPNPPNHGGTNGYSGTKIPYDTLPNGTQEPTSGWSRPSAPNYGGTNGYSGTKNPYETVSNGTHEPTTGGWSRPRAPNYGGTNGYSGTKNPYETVSNGTQEPTTGGWARPSAPSHVGTNGYSGTKIPYETVSNGIQEPAIITTGGWERPSRVGWATPPTHDSPLGKPTNDIGTAIEYIKEAIKPPYDKTFTPERRLPVPRINSPTPAIDSKEAARRYNGMMGFSMPSAAVPSVNAPTQAIDSNEAARRYNGMMVNADK